MRERSGAKIKMKLLTERHCLLCLNATNGSRNEIESSSSLYSLSSVLVRYLNINLKAIFGNLFVKLDSTSTSELFYSPEKFDISAELCSDCEKMTEETTRLIELVKCYEEKLNNSLENILKKMLDNNKYSTGRTCPTFGENVEHLRKEFFNNCSKRACKVQRKKSSRSKNASGAPSNDSHATETDTMNWDYNWDTNSQTSFAEGEGQDFDNDMPERTLPDEDDRDSSEEAAAAPVDNTHKCRYCSGVFTVEHELEEHVSKCHPTVECYNCHKMIPRGLYETTHLHPCLSRVQCTIPGCKKTFPGKRSLARHLEMHAEKEPCEDCKERTCTIHLLRCCIFCHDRFLNCPSLNRHLVTQHRNKMKCHICKLVFSSLGLLTYHYKLAHSMVMELDTEESHEPKCSKQRLKCDVCKRTFPNEQSLYEHCRRSYKKPKPKPETFDCEQCGRKCKEKWDLRYHIKKVHMQVRYSCTHLGCNKHYNREELLTIHVETVHPNSTSTENQVSPDKDQQNSSSTVPEESDNFSNCEN